MLRESLEMPLVQINSITFFSFPSSEMVDLDSGWSESFAKHAQSNLLLEIPSEFAKVLASTNNAADFIMRVQNGLHRSTPEIAETLRTIERVMVQLGQVSFVEILQDKSSEAASPSNKKKTPGFKCESTLQVCQLLTNYLSAQRRLSRSSSSMSTAESTSGKETSFDAPSMNLIIKPWLDIDTGCEFRIFIIGVHIHAIFQRKGGPAHTNAEAKKLFRMILMGFLRTAQLEDAHLTEYMVDVFITLNRKVWVLDVVSLKEAKKPTPGEWAELSLASKQSAPPSSNTTSATSASAVSSNSSNTNGNFKSSIGGTTIDTSPAMLATGSIAPSPLPSPLLPHTPLPHEVRSMNLPYRNTSIEKNNLECVSADANTAQVRALAVAAHSNSATFNTTSGGSNGNSSGSSMSDRKGLSLQVEVPTSPQATQYVESFSSPAPTVANNTSNNSATPTTHATQSAAVETTTTPAKLPHTPTTNNVPESPLSVDLDGDAHSIPSYLMEKYKLGPVLGKGAYANVREGTDKETGKQVAVKILHRCSVKTSAEVSVRREVHILSMLNHPNIVRTYAFYEEPEYFYTVLECIHGGALFDRVKTKTLFTESTVRELAYVLLGAIKHCHDHHVVHRDLKPENLLMTSADNNQDLKIVDFGFAAIDTGGCVLTDRCGTPMYVAPEILQKIPHGKPVDMWSFGVILFLLLSGDAPFKDPNVKALYAKISSGQFHFKSNWTNVSPLAVDLVKQLLVVSQLDRLTVDEAMNHAWFKARQDELPNTHLATVVEGLRSFQAAQRFRKGVNAVKALNRMKVQHQLSRSEYIETMNSKYPKEVEARYTVGEVLGRGGYATVWSATSKLDQRAVAIKIIPRDNLKPATELGIRRETEILRHLHHKNIVKSYDFIDTDTHFNVVLERVHGGELFDRIIKKKFYNEKEARDLAVVILKALKHCHDHKIAHRDLKPENLLMTGTNNESADLKLVDFGFAAKCDGYSLTNQCGTPAYVAPEIIRKHPHGVPVDMWSFGVILYILLCGYPPFRDKEEKKLFLKIRAGVYEFHPKYWDKISEEAKDLIRKLLVIDPVNRLTVEQALSHPWIHADGKVLSSYDLSESLSEMELFQNSKKFKVGVNVLLAVQKMSKAALFRSNSNVNSEANTPLSSPMPQNKEKLSPRLNPGGGESEGKEVTSPGSPKASAGASTNKRMANLLFSAAAKAASGSNTTPTTNLDSPVSGATPAAVAALSGERASYASTSGSSGTRTPPRHQLPSGGAATILSLAVNSESISSQTPPRYAIQSPNKHIPLPTPPKANTQVKPLRPGYFVDANGDTTAASNNVGIATQYSDDLTLSHSNSGGTAAASIPTETSSVHNNNTGPGDTVKNAQLVEMMHNLHLENQSTDL